MKEKPRGLFILILVLATLATALFFWRLFFFKGEPGAKPTPISPTPTSSLLPSNIPSPITTPQGKGDTYQGLLENLKDKFPLYELIPHQDQGFRIDYVGPLHLKVTLKEDTPEVRQKALDWIWSSGVDPSTHQIDWQTGL